MRKVLLLAFCVAAREETADSLLKELFEERGVTYPPGGSAAAYNWTHALHRVHATMRQALASYQSTADEALALALEKRDHAVWIVDGKIYVDRAFLGAMKDEMHLKTMRAVLQNSKRLGNDTALTHVGSGVSVYGYEASATGGHHCNQSLPFLVIAKKADDACGVMIPNPYFENPYGEWRHDFEELQALGTRKDWAKRNPRVFWRGQVRGHPQDPCGRDAGNFARLSAAALTLRYPRLFDVRPTACAPRGKSDCDDAFQVNSYEKRAVSNKCRAVTGAFVHHGKFADFRYLLDLPGSTSGSYSRNLNHLWLLGAVVMIWTGPLLDDDGGGTQWYSPALQDGHTHLLVTRDSAPKFAEALSPQSSSSSSSAEKNSSAASFRRYLVANARDVAMRFLCPDCIIRFFMTVLHGIRTQMPDLFDVLNAPPGYDVAARRKKILYHKDRCKKLNLVQVVGDSPGGRGHARMEHWKVATRPLRGSACDFLDRGSHKWSPGIAAKRYKNHTVHLSALHHAAAPE